MGCACSREVGAGVVDGDNEGGESNRGSDNECAPSSYLCWPRVSFEGVFQADVDFINNNDENWNPKNYQVDIDNWNNDTMPDLQENSPIGTGTGSFRFVNGLQVTRVVVSGKTSENDDDPFNKVQMFSNLQMTDAKLVDLHVDNQGVSTIFGLQVSFRYPNDDGSWVTVMAGHFRPAPFTYITNNKKGQGDVYMIATYQSVLENIHFPDTDNRTRDAMDASRVYKSFKNHVDANKDAAKLSIKFTLDNFTIAKNPNGTNSNYSLLNGGRICGFIGIHNGDNEPLTFSRRIMAFTPANQSYVRTAPFWVHQKRVTVDLSSAFEMTRKEPSCPYNLVDMGNLYLEQENSEGGWERVSEEVAPSTYQSNWVVDFPLLEDQSMGKRCFRVSTSSDGQTSAFVTEVSDGLVAQTDNMVHRADTGGEISFPLQVFQWGDPVHNAAISLSMSSMVPKKLLGSPQKKITSKNGIATIGNLKVSSHVPSYLPGDVYNISFTEAEIDGETFQLTTNRANFNSGNATVMVYFPVEEVSDPTWEDIKDVFEQFHALYGCMHMLFDLNKEEDVRKNSERILKAMSLDMSNPRYMPVTRDISPKKMKMILSWLEKVVREKEEKEKPISNAPGGVLAGPSVVASDVELEHWPKIKTVGRLHCALQQMIELEHATIPLYLTAMWSIKEGDKIRDLVRSVVHEEMGHMALAANLLTATGGTPELTHKEFIPTFPGHLPYGVEPELMLHLRQLDQRQAETFVAVESPKPPSGYSIGAAYNTIVDGLKYLCAEIGEEKLFVGSMDLQFPVNGIYITNLDTALKAVHEIVEQGEGSLEVEGDPYVSLDGVPKAELAHYYKFQEIVHGRTLTYNKSHGVQYNGSKLSWQCVDILSNPNVDNVRALTNAERDPAKKQRMETALAKMIRCNDAYSRMLNSLEKTFTVNAEENMQDAISLMKLLSIEAQQLVDLEFDGKHRLTPSFETPEYLLEETETDQVEWPEPVVLRNKERFLLAAKETEKKSRSENAST